MAHIIVVGNEKGGAGKSTVAMHLAAALGRLGRTVGCLDLDLRQQSLARYVENRAQTAARQGVVLPMPTVIPLPEIDPADLAPGEHPLDRRLSDAIAQAEPTSDYVVIDCPGSHTRLAQVAHTLADTLVTPLNDSFVDFDLLARLDPASGRVLGPSVYSEMVWSARQVRAQAGLAPIDWVVLRNRVGAQAMTNKARMGEALENLSKRIGFRIAPGFSERVVFRELFPRGLTLLDLRDIGVEKLSMSAVAARQELRELMRSLALPGLHGTL